MLPPLKTNVIFYYVAARLTCRRFSFFFKCKIDNEKPFSGRLFVSIISVRRTAYGTILLRVRVRMSDSLHPVRSFTDHGNAFVDDPAPYV